MSARRRQLPLSVCCLTHVSPGQTRAALAGVQDVASEIVLGIDARQEARIDEYAAIADRVIALPTGVVEQYLTILHDACTQPWILRLDSDEVASPALVAALPELVADTRIAQYWIARRWLTQDGQSWIDEAPWWPDYQVRLVRADGVTFSGALHSSAEPASPRGMVLAPLYHADTALHDLAHRRRKVAFYAVSGGSPFFDGQAARVYEPERFARRPYEPVPAADLPVIVDLLEAAGAHLVAAPPTSSSEPAAADRSSPGRDAVIELAERDPRFVQGDGRTLTVVVTNTTSAGWPGEHHPDLGVFLSHRWRWDDGERQEGIRTPFCIDVEPGETRAAALAIATPERTGPVWLEVGVVDEHVGWLDGLACLRAEVQAPVALPTRREGLAPRRNRWRRWIGRAPTVPRTFHRVWLGDAPMPEEHVEYGRSWERLHPDWTMRLWSEEDAPAPPGVERARNLAERADLVRYEVLRRHGGVYLDTDVECLRSIDELLHGVCAFAAYEVPGRLCNAVIGATPGHRAFEAAVDLVQTTVGRGVYPNATATSFLTYVLEADPEVTLFGPERFYPTLWDGLSNPAPDDDPPHAIHHWAKSWLQADTAARLG